MFSLGDGQGALRKWGEWNSLCCKQLYVLDIPRGLFLPIGEQCNFSINHPLPLAGEMAPKHALCIHIPLSEGMTLNLTLSKGSQKHYQLKKCAEHLWKRRPGAMKQGVRHLHCLWHLIWTQEMQDSRQMRTETKAPKSSLVQVITGSCFTSHCTAFWLYSLPHSAELLLQKTGGRTWSILGLDSRCTGKHRSKLTEETK